MPDGSPVNLGSGLPETVLPPEPADARARLAAALEAAPAERRAAVAAVVRDHPRSLTGWADLGDLARDDVEAYACYRVGYHRGLDALRGNGWRGSGFVRWAHESNRGFLRSLAGLGRTAQEIGEVDEAARCEEFLQMLDPEARP
ncbi:MAG TPA: DUF3151 domain-containing protein [Acidimicrobiales bacterium]|nr:DUF3151 domain-containing protein [Acidimicrobiales bacterium]